MLYHGSVGASSRHFVVAVVVAVGGGGVDFHHKICVSIIFNSFLDEASNFRHRILTNQKQKFVIENCEWKCMSQYFLNRNIHYAYYLGLTSFGIKKHIRLLLLRCFGILLLNWDIRLSSLSGFHISHRKIRSNTRINTLFQLTSTRLRYHITFIIAVVIQATEKQFPWHKWLKNEISDYVTLFYLATTKLKHLTTLTTVFYFCYH